MRVLCSLVLAGTLVALSVPAIAQDDQPVVSAEELAKMDEIFASYASAGPEHKHLDPLVGTYEYTSSFWPMAGMDPMIDSGTAEYSWEYEGRFLRQSASGTSMGMPFAGTGIMGFDRYRGEHFLIWYDNMTTSVMMIRGAADETGKAITYEGTHDNVWEDKKDVWVKSILTIGDDAHTLSMYVKDPDGKEFKNFEIQYTRAKMAAK